MRIFLVRTQSIYSALCVTIKQFQILSLFPMARGKYDYTPVSYAGNGHGGLIGAPSFLRL